MTSRDGSRRGSGGEDVEAMMARRENEPDEIVESAADGAEPASEAAQETRPVEGADPDVQTETEAHDGSGARAGVGDGESESAEPVDPLDELRAERDELHDRWLRAVAEMDNLRRRTRREVTDARRFAVADLLRRFLGLQDDFERALQNMPDKEGEQSPEPARQLADLRTGVELISQRVQSVLGETGVTRIEALGEPFDPAFHEAVGHRAEEGAESGCVVEVLQEGYILGDLVLRPSRVVIAP